MRRLLPLLTIIFLFTLHSPEGVKAAPRVSLAQSPGEIMALINAYRAENGLPAYQQNSILMQTAQGQADYQASIESVTHEGPGGTRPRDRAYAAGYGGGEIVFISEIIYGATSAGPGTAVSWWKTSQIHNDTMLASTYQEFGAGVATANDRNYYVAVTGYVAGGSYIPPSTSENEDNTDTNEVLVPAVVVIPVVIATPQGNGSIIHIIRSGQTLWTVAAVYQVPLADILATNNLPENAVIYPGDEIIIQAANQEGPTPTETSPTASASATATATPKSSVPVATATLTTSVALSSDSVENNSSGNEIEEGNATTRIVVAIVLIGVAVVMVASFFIIPKPPSPTEENDPFAPLN
jgi:uncharacterized protein YkwD